MSIRALAAAVGVTPCAISRYSRGTSPSVAVAQRIAKVLDVPLDYLVSSPDTHPAGGPFCRDPTAHRIIDQLGLEELLLVYRLGSTGVAWQIASFLAACHPHPVPESVLRKHLVEVDSKTLQGHLIGLRRRDVISRTDSPRAGGAAYGLTSSGAILSAKTPGDLHWHAYQAVRHLLQSILPAVERQDDSGYLFTMTATTTREVGLELAHDLKHLVKNRCQKLPDQVGSEELKVVLGVAFNSKKG